MGWFRNRNKNSSDTNNTYKITYVMSCSITGNKVTFDLNNRLELIIQATDEFDAAAKAFSLKKLTPYPHVYIDDIKKITIIR